MNLHENSLGLPTLGLVDNHVEWTAGLFNQLYVGKYSV